MASILPPNLGDLSVKKQRKQRKQKKQKTIDLPPPTIENTCRPCILNWQYGCSCWKPDSEDRQMDCSKCSECCYDFNRDLDILKIAPLN